MSTFTSQNEQETIKIAGALAKSLKGGETICLIGPLGAGKTIFAKGLVQKLGLKKSIRSPSFVLMKIYPLGRVRQLCHIDAYRIKKVRELLEIGVLEYLAKRNTICLIEWADKIKKILPKRRIEVKIKFGRRENERKIEISRYNQ
jgi:tRNA threonylcarbamoyladenosine biosynthesis protein TsaE